MALIIRKRKDTSKKEEVEIKSLTLQMNYKKRVF